MAHKIDLATASSEIRSAYEWQSPRSPFFFVVGAGVSYPSIPLACTITEHCRQKAIARGFTEHDSDQSGLSSYSLWFDRAYPQPIDRQRYLRSLIENAGIPTATFRLAHALLSRKVTNLVITPNFDDLLSRALAIFGESHIVADHPRTVDRLDLESKDIQIVHVHGSYRFYDCRNLQEELTNRAQPSLSTTSTMAALLDRVLSFRSPIVIGYSGWEDDVIMAALRRRIDGNSIPYRLYWCCYDEDTLKLPEWLSEHSDVRIVVQKRKAEVAQDAASRSSEPAAASQDTEKPTLSAQLVLEELSRTFDIGEPELTKDPIQFFAKQLKRSIYRESGQKDGVYFFSDVITRVERAAELERAERASRSVKADRAEALLASIKEFVRESKYHDAMAQSLDIPVEALSPENAEELFDILSLCVKESNEVSDRYLEAIDLLVALGERLANPEDSVSVHKYCLVPLTRKGDALRRVRRYDEAISLFDAIKGKFGGGGYSLSEGELPYVETRKLLCLSAAGRYSEGLDLSKEILPVLETLDPSRWGWLVRQTLYNRALDLKNLNRHEDALSAFTGFVDRYKDATDGWTQVLVASALRGMAQVSRAMGNISDAIKYCDNLIQLYGTSEHSQVSKLVQQAIRLRQSLVNLPPLSQASEQDGVGEK